MPMTRPLVSIVIPCFNAERALGDAIHSALEQVYPSVEVVVVDDGSTDSSLKVARSFGAAVRVVSGPNVGAAAARNKGAAVATGELIQFLDADDRLYSEKLQRQVPLALQHRPDMVFCDADVVDGQTGHTRGVWATGAISTADAVVHALMVIVQTAGPLHWRESFNRVGGFRPHTPPCDDRDLHLRLACAGVRFHHLAAPLYQMRRFAGSLSKRDPGRGVEIQRDIGEDALATVTNAGSLSPIREAAFAAYFASTGRAALRAGKRQLGLACFRRAAEIHRGGGFRDIYSPVGRLVATWLGPTTAEHLSRVGKAIRGHRELA